MVSGSRCTLAVLTGLTGIAGVARIRAARDRRAHERAGSATLARLAAVPADAGEIVLAGDGIFAEGDWPDLLAPHPVRCLAGPGVDTTELARRGAGLAAGPAAAVVVSAGSTELAANRPIADIVHDLAVAVDELVEVLEPGRVVVCSLLPRPDRWSRAVPTTDRELARVAHSRGVVWLDLWPLLADGRRRLDRVHRGSGGRPAGSAHRRVAERLVELLPAPAGQGRVDG